MNDFQPIMTAFRGRTFDHQQIQRVFHGRGHCYPELDFVIVDWYPPVLFVALYRRVDEAWLKQLCDSLWQHRPPLMTALVVQQRQGANTQAELIYGELPQPHVVYEAGIRYQIQLQHSQNIGIFPDMVNGRAWVRANSQDANVLNLFAYTCGFSLVALAGGASQVVNIDMNKSVLGTGRVNHRLNQLNSAKALFFSHNIFNSWGKIKRYGLYDLIIIDPPSFQKGSFVLTKDYERLIIRLPTLTTATAKVLLCLNSPDVSSDFILGLVADHCPALKFVQRIDNHADFPEIDSEKSLKVLLFQMTAGG